MKLLHVYAYSMSSVSVNRIRACFAPKPHLLAIPVTAQLDVAREKGVDLREFEANPMLLRTTAQHAVDEVGKRSQRFTLYSCSYGQCFVQCKTTEKAELGKKFDALDENHDGKLSKSVRRFWFEFVSALCVTTLRFELRHSSHVTSLTGALYAGMANRKSPRC